MVGPVLLDVLAEDLQMIVQPGYCGWIWYRSAPELRELTSSC